MCIENLVKQETSQLYWDNHCTKFLHIFFIKVEEMIIIHYIYKITNHESKKVYIGRTENPKKRFVGHKSKLNTNTHSNKWLQKDYNSIVDAKSITYEILIEVNTLYEALYLEEFYVEYYKESAYNIMGGGRRGLPSELHPLLGKKHTEETKQKIKDSISKIDRRGENNSFFGKQHSIETKKTISENRKGKSLGADNPYSKKVFVNGEIYDTVKEGIEASGLARYSFYKKIRDDNYKDIRYVN